MNGGHSPIVEEPGLEERVAAAMQAGRLTATTDTAAAVRQSNVVVVIVPLLVVVLLTPVSENWLGTPRYVVGIAIFLAAALTDFFDGRIARRRSQVSNLGKLLDPIADKLLISAALISLVENHLAPAWAVVIIVGREFAVTGLRSIAAADGVVISASGMGNSRW